jgi:catechol 2,3-dioxygenase-like lactoylglutathione lyase family enzyme
MAITRSLKTKLTTTRFEESCAWYQDLFGLTVLEEWDLPGDKGCILGISGAEGEALLEIFHGAGVFEYSGLSLQFRVEDVNSFVIPLEPRFAHRGPEVRPWGSHYLFLNDPNGVSVVVFSGTSL